MIVKKLAKLKPWLIGLSLSGMMMGSAAAVDPVTLNIWFTDSRSQYKTWVQEAADAYQKENPHVNFEIVQMSPNDAYVKWPAAIASGTTPDITWMFFAFSSWINDLPGGELADMGDVIDNLGADNFQGEALEPWVYKDKYLGVPYTRQPFFIVYRKDLFEKAGLEEPKTWDDVIEAAKALHKPKEGQFGIALGGKNDWTVRQNFELVLYSNGGHLLSKEGEPIFDNDTSRKAIDIYAELFKYTPPGGLNAGYAEVNRAFAQGNVAMAISLPVIVSQYGNAHPGEEDNVGIVIPSDEDLQITMQNNKGWSIFEKSENVEEAKKFVQSMFSTDNYARGMEVAALAGAPAYTTPEIEEKIYAEDAPIGKYPAIAEQMKSDFFGYYSGIDWFGQNPKGGLVGSKGVLERNLNNRLAGKYDTDETIKRIQKELEEIFNE